MTAPLGNQLMQIFFRLSAEQQELLVHIAEGFVDPQSLEQDGEAVQPLRLVVGNRRPKKGGA